MTFPDSAAMRDPVAVGVLMGSQSDWSTMQAAVAVLEAFQVPHEVRIVSAHRTPDRLRDYALTAEARGFQVIIAGAGGAAHLPGMLAAYTTVPVLGVPVESAALKGMDSLLSIVQMPGGVPVATFAIGVAGAKNAALFAVSLLGQQNPKIREALAQWRKVQSDSVASEPTRVNRAFNP
jgi:5-(carboxyamino)imidazole ribonucleotide mutase